MMKGLKQPTFNAVYRLLGCCMGALGETPGRTPSKWEVRPSTTGRQFLKEVPRSM